MPTPDSLTAWTLAATVEHHLIRAQAAARTNVAFASRPLNKDERAAKTRFQDLDDLVQVNTKGGVDLITALYAGALAALLSELFGDDEDEDAGEDSTDEEDAITAAALAAALALLLSYRPPTYTRTQDSAQEYLGTLMGRTYQGGVATVLAEAKRQGVDTTQFTRPDAPDTLGDMAANVAGHPWTRTVERALHHYQTPAQLMGPPITRGQLETFLADTSQAGTVDLLQQANHAALNAGRNDTASSYAGAFLVAVASEILDKNTCGPCAAIDGTRFTTQEDARAAYPAGYVNCEGGSRCRGVIIYVFDKPAEDD